MSEESKKTDIEKQTDAVYMQSLVAKKMHREMDEWLNSLKAEPVPRAMELYACDYTWMNEVLIAVENYELLLSCEQSKRLLDMPAPLRACARSALSRPNKYLARSMATIVLYVADTQ